MNALVRPHIAIDDIEIRTDVQGRFCLNDLHKASGEEIKNRPATWLQNQQTQALAVEVEKDGIPSIYTKQGVGTFVRKELVYAYAMWISPTFNLKVIRTFDAVATGQLNPVNLSRLQLLEMAMQAEQDRLALEHQVVEMKSDVEAFDRIAKADGSLCLRDAANNLQMRQNEFIKWLQLNNWIYKRVGNAAWHGYSDKLQAGYLEHKTDTISRPDGSEKITEQVRVTPKGLTKLSRLLGNNNV